MTHLVKSVAYFMISKVSSRGVGTMCEGGKSHCKMHPESYYIFVQAASAMFA